MKKFSLYLLTVLTVLLTSAVPAFAVNLTATAHVQDIGWSATRF